MVYFQVSIERREKVKFVSEIVNKVERNLCPLTLYVSIHDFKALRSAARMVAAVEILHNIGKDTEIGKILLSLAVTQKSAIYVNNYK